MKKAKRNKKHTSWLGAASIGRSSLTEQVRRHSGDGLANTGTNISYEGATAPGAGGSAGTGYASGKEAVDEKISTNSDFVQNRGGHVAKDNPEDEEINYEALDDDFYIDENF